MEIGVPLSAGENISETVATPREGPDDPKKPQKSRRTIKLGRLISLDQHGDLGT
jgi:hypothetical protein